MSSVKEKFNEIMSDLGGRVRNPLIVSFVFVWLYQNWSLIYIYFNLNPDFSFGEKLFILRIYLNGCGVNGIFWNPLLFAFISLSIYYLIAIVAQLTKHLLGERLNAAIILVFDKSKYVLKIKHNKVLEENRKLKLKEEASDNEMASYKSKLRQKEAELEKVEDDYNSTIEKKDTEYGQLSATNKRLVDENGKLRISKDSSDKAKENLSQQLSISESKNEQYLKTNQLLNIDAEIGRQISTNPEDIFGEGKWFLNWEKNGVKHNELFRLITDNGNNFFVTENHRILITKFRYDKENNTVSFLKSNIDKGYSDVIVLLYIHDFTLMSGIEGKNLLVDYVAQNSIVVNKL